MARQPTLRWHMARHLIDYLRQQGQPVHWLVLAAELERVFRAGNNRFGRSIRYPIDNQEFGRIMAIAKVIGLTTHDNPFPIYESRERKGFWGLGNTNPAVGVDVPGKMRAVLMAEKVARGRDSNLLKQLESEQVARPDDDQLRVITRIESRIEETDLFISYIERLLRGWGGGGGGGTAGVPVKPQPR